MTYALALEILEDHEHALQARDECRAEAGMGAVSLGFSGYDGMAVWSANNPFEPDPRLDEARAYVAQAPDIYYVDPAYPGPQVCGPGPARYLPSSAPALPF